MSYENPTIEKEETVEDIIDKVAEKDPRIKGKEFDPDATGEYKVTPEELEMIRQIKEAQPHKAVDEIVRELQEQGLLDEDVAA